MRAGFRIDIDLAFREACLFLRRALDYVGIIVEEFFLIALRSVDALSLLTSSASLNQGLRSAILSFLGLRVTSC